VHEIAVLSRYFKTRRQSPVFATYRFWDVVSNDVLCRSGLHCALALAAGLLYEEYVNELVKINSAKYALIKEYLQNENMTDGLSKRWVEVDESVVQLRLKYIPIFRKVLSAKSTAMFFNSTGAYK
jgi:hypothetical protein